jgi:exodeoxyribonuclease VII large subunit
MNSIKPNILSVSQINNQVKHKLDSQFSHVWIEGEISGFKKYPSGHIYFTLKDNASQISAVMLNFNSKNLNFIPSTGKKVIIHGCISIYVPRGNYQINVENMYPVGEGELWLKFNKLKEKLEAEGLFDLSHKKIIPKFPKKIGIVTSSSGSVLRDIIHVCSRRAPHVELVLSPTSVQGVDASAEIVSAIKALNDYDKVDTIIVGRGGGSMEDLWCFNDELLARTIFESNIPVISAVGHETDFTIADFVSDHRAPTPSAGAEIAVPQKHELIQYLDEIEDKFQAFSNTYIFKRFEIIENLLHRHGFHQPNLFLQSQIETIDYLERMYISTIQKYLDFNNDKVQSFLRNLMNLNPKEVFKRGYAMVTDSKGNILSSIHNVKVKDKLDIQILDGNIQTEVISAGESNDKQ